MNIALFGSTGSIGKKVLDIVRLFPDEFKIKMLGVRKNVQELNNQIKEFSPKFIYVSELNNVDRNILGTNNILTGYEGIVEICNSSEVDTIIVAVDGYYGVFPTIEGIKAKKKILTANKESIFIWGYEIMLLAEKEGVEVIPLDSEHNTIFNLISKIGKNNVSKYIITASGGPFLNKSIEEIKNMKFDDAMKHPNWKMGKNVTINSATMFNKFLEVFEAHIFFNIPISSIEVVIHPESRIHSMVLLQDGTIWMTYYPPDMLFPIANAMFYPHVPNLVSRNIEIDSITSKTLRFLPLDKEKFPITSLIDKLESTSSLERAILNTANEICISLFEEGNIEFSDISEIVIECYTKFKTNKNLEVSKKLNEEMKDLETELRYFITRLVD
ncbi:MAG: 1-deoxy-D-xylulose-5-phosphate reductoisomerase [Brevinematales bacterium]|nr:1-deoxy-D-xylulose-5-phosphate reductoisomerase [Brevinematales bacterium]